MVNVLTNINDKRLSNLASVLCVKLALLNLCLTLAAKEASGAASDTVGEPTKNLQYQKKPIT